MNSRRTREPDPQNTNCPRPVSSNDQRPLVLLFIGLLVIGVHIAGRNHAEIDAANGAGSLIWLAGGTFQDGVYSVSPRLLPPMTSDPSGLYRAAGLTPPDTSDLAAKAILADPDRIPFLGLRLENGRPPAVIDPPAVYHSFMFLPIPINEADRELLITVPGIGPRLAEQILALRRKNKQFTRPEDLLVLPGIGRRRLQHLVDHLSFKQAGS